MSSTLAELTEADVLALSERAGDPDWLRDARQEAFKAFSDLEWPHNRVEEWRFTNPDRFDFTRELVDGGDGASDLPARDRGIVAALEGKVAATARLVDNELVEASVEPGLAEAGLVVTDLSSGARDHRKTVEAALGSAVGTDEKFDALNLAAFTGGVLVRVPKETKVADPITVTIQAEAEGAHVPRVLVVLEPFAEANVYVDHAGGGEATVVEVVEVVVGDGAQTRLVTAQDWGDSVDHIATHRGLVGRDAYYRHLEATLGGRTVYIRPDVRLDENGAHGELFGVYFGSNGQQFEHRSLIHHNASKTSSESIYKGALQGTARATWYGNIRIEPHAKATSSDETNRNLILTDGAHADSIPFLEIMCSDVIECGHHSSVGQVDENQLFYLEARGISRPEAVRMLVFGFFGEITDRIELPGVTDTVLAEVEREIHEGPTALMDPTRR